MVALLMLTLLQAPAAPPPPTPALAPATQTAKPKPRPAAGGATTNALFFITDPSGASIEGVKVTITGPADREATSPGGGFTRVQGLRAGTYRVRFTHERFITFEKEFSWRAGTATPELSITLNPAPPPPAPPPPVAATPPPSAAPKLPPPGTPRTLSLPDFIEKNFISNREGHKESMVGCSGVGQAVLWQVREPWDGRQHDSADGLLYIIGGDGSIRLDGREVSVTAGSFAVVPRGTTYGFTRRGRNPLVVLAVLAGAPCAVD
ncbi:MAG: carboxypeptidase regulatory-like domain-containing protein [Acidobacteriota bacterium]|nr:carboxypeptidase regulatory-like domain-containing protein [Acidobacteriota bacterium]